MDATTAAASGSDIQIVDVREDDEWNAGHIQGALHIPLSTLSARIAELDDTKTLVTVCRSGGRSSKARSQLIEAGKRADHIDGGMQQWQRAGLPITTPDGKPGQVV